MLGVSKVWGTIYIIILIYQLKPEWMLQWIISRKPKIILGGGGNKLWGSLETRSETARFTVRWGFHFCPNKFGPPPRVGALSYLRTSWRYSPVKYENTYVLSTSLLFSMGRSLFVIKSLKFLRYYSNSTNSNNNSETERIYTSNPLDKDKNMIVYIDIHSLKPKILEENKGKSGIYMFTNKVTKDFYIGQSKNLYNRFLNYFNPSYIRRLKNSIIGRAITKYGYSNFSLTILEYCDKDNLTAREQYYFDTLNPVYNILKIAGAYVDVFTHSEETSIAQHRMYSSPPPMGLKSRSRWGGEGGRRN